MNWEHLYVSREVSDALSHFLPNGNPDGIKNSFKERTLYWGDKGAEAVYQLTCAEFNRAVDHGYKIDTHTVDKVVGNALMRVKLKYSKEEILAMLLTGSGDKDIQTLMELPKLRVIEYLLDGHTIDFSL